MAFADEIRVDSAVLSRIENARVPLKCDIFWRLHSRFPISPQWLATGEGEKSLVMTLPGMNELGINGTDSFSSAFDGKLRKLANASAKRSLTAEMKDDAWCTGTFAPTARGRLDAILELETNLQTWLAVVPDASLNAFVRDLKKTAKKLLGKCPTDAHQTIVQRAKEIENLRDEWQLRGLLHDGKTFPHKKRK